MKFCVITRVPDPEKGEAGNMATAFPLYIETEQPSPANHFKAKIESVFKVMGANALAFRSPVFDLGEILIVDSEYGREVGGGRKPSKWDVDADYFDDIEDAIARSQEVTDAAHAS
jgi:hypothetical protein